ncbi:MAG TPA: hypothetical protein VKC51_07205 [Lacunisphaera sp.]|nr:hypothetical protein [Lacunisphaera sp.]
MKTVPFVLLLALPLVLTAMEVRPGDTLNNVRATLGAPRGQLRVDGRQLLYYERGEIELRAGAVTRVALLSEEDHAAREARRAAAAVRFREEQEILCARLSTEGEALKARKLADPSFLAAPLAYQVAFWEDFSRRYPDVASAEQLTIAHLRLAEQLEEKRDRELREERLAELEARLLAAEDRATRYRSYTSFNSDGYARHPFTFWPVEYHFFDSPLPYAVSPSQFSVPPVYRTDYVPVFSDDPMDNNSRCERSDPRRHDHHSGRRDRF